MPSSPQGVCLVEPGPQGKYPVVVKQREESLHFGGVMEIPNVLGAGDVTGFDLDQSALLGEGEYMILPGLADIAGVGLCRCDGEGLYDSWGS